MLVADFLDCYDMDSDVVAIAILGSAPRRMSSRNARHDRKCSRAWG